MNKITFTDSYQNRTRKTKRWLGMLAFCATLFGGQTAFAQIAQSYDFDDETLQGWVNSGDAEFYSTTSGQCGGASGIQLNMYTYEDWWGGGIVYVSPNTLTSPNIGTSDGTEASMSFLYKAVNYGGGTAANADAFEMELQWANSSSGPWTTFYTIDEDNHTPSSDCTTVNLTFTPGTGDLYVRFNSELLDEYEDILIYLDDIQISQGDAPCFPPTGLTATDISLTGATLGWTSDGDEFELEWGVQGFEQGSTDGTIVTGINTNSYELTVTEGGNYDFYVRQICDSGESTWAGPFSFHVFVLGDDCSAPITIDALPYTTTDDTANYSDNPNIEGSPGASGCGTTSSYLNGNDVVYSYTADSDGTIIVNISGVLDYSGIFAYASCDDIGTACIGGAVNGYLGGGTAEFELNVEDSETYYFVISTWASPQTTAYTLEITQLLCANPVSLTATDISTQGATLGWTSDGNDFEVEWGVQDFVQGSTDGTIVTGINSNSYELTVTEGGNYDFWVRQICDTGESNWTGPYSFTIPCLPTTVPYVQDFDSAAVPDMPSCTSVENAGSGNNWVTNSSSSYGFTENHLRYSWNSSNNANSWFYTQGIELEAETTYKVSYDYGGTGTTFPEKLKVAYGDSPSSVSMTTVLADHTNVVNETPTNNEVEFTPTTSGVYYFGFNAYSDADKFYLHLDNISIDVVTDDPCDGITPPEIESPQSLDEGQTLADVVVTAGENLTWYTDEDLTETADTSEALTEGEYTFFVTQTVGDCTSEAVEVVINVTNPCDGITTPEIESPQSLDEGQTLADVVVTEGENLTWYTDEDLTETADTSEALTEGEYTFFVTQTVGDCTSEATEVVITVTLSLSEFDTTQLKVYPNPTNGELNISYTDTINQVEVYNLLGQKVITQNFESNDVSLNVSHLSNGSYILILHANGLKQQVKIVKK
ncbi:T9SS type A sorting domain-containing protein [Avrilella dinanensis]|uniref:Fibronectin type-III domain-containing protein n=1 Tax=Avrilella dinanensis TaxID=2008672 RepID=A0A2M9R727_9FLAO|nr:T9SS type A sorting domain-containing protein [Avrilella dinanensis]PJR04654.1 hypothetical protein CDL10_08970 [Avrilella dinanensis]